MVADYTNKGTYQNLDELKTLIHQIHTFSGAVPVTDRHADLLQWAVDELESHADDIEEKANEVKSLEEELREFEEVEKALASDSELGSQTTEPIKDEGKAERLKELHVQTLKEKLRGYGLKVSGVKGELVERIIEHESKLERGD